MHGTFYCVWKDLITYAKLLIIFSYQALKLNGSLYAHIFFARSGYPPDPNDPEYQPLAAFGRTHRKIVSLINYR